METSRDALPQPTPPPTTAPTTDDCQPPPNLPDYWIETAVDRGAIQMTYDGQTIVPLNSLCCEFSRLGHPLQSTIHFSLPPHWTLQDLRPGGLIWSQLDDQHWTCLVGPAQMAIVAISGGHFTSTWKFVPPTGGQGFDARVTIKHRLSQEP